MTSNASHLLAIFACLSAFFIVSTCVPLAAKSGEYDNDTNHDYILIDQRQNGSANYRLNMNGVVIAFTPLESLLTGALDDFDFSDEFELNKPPEELHNSTETHGVDPPLAGGAETNATSHKNGGKFKRRRHGSVSGLMRTIFNQRKNGEDGKIK